MFRNFIFSLSSREADFHHGRHTRKREEKEYLKLFVSRQHQQQQQEKRKSPRQNFSITNIAFNYAESEDERQKEHIIENKIKLSWKHFFVAAMKLFQGGLKNSVREKRSRV